MCGDENLENEICYTGGIYDEGTGLYYLNARYYNPQDGRFLSQDTYRGEMTDYGTWNLYTYCANNPVNYIDPSGHASEMVIAIPIAVLLIFFVGLTVRISYELWELIKGAYYCGRKIAKVVVEYTYRTVVAPKVARPRVEVFPDRSAEGVGRKVGEKVGRLGSKIKARIKMSKGGKQNIRDSRFQGQKPEDLDAQKKEIEKEIRRASDPEKIKRLKKLRQDLVKHLKRDARNKQSKARYRHSK